MSQIRKLELRRATLEFLRLSAVGAAFWGVAKLKATPPPTQPITWTSDPVVLTQEELNAALGAVQVTATNTIQKNGTIPSIEAAQALVAMVENNLAQRESGRKQDALANRKVFVPAKDADLKVTGDSIIFDVVEWQDATHSATKFHQWFVWDKRGESRALLWEKATDLLNHTFMSGETSLSVVSIYFGDSTTDSKTTQPDDLPQLMKSVTYNIQEAKAASSFMMELKIALGIVSPIGVPDFIANTRFLAPSPPPTKPGVTPIGYTAIDNFADDYTASTITLGTKYFGEKTAEVSPTFANEGESYFGLSAMVPVTTYTDVTFQGSSNNLVPQSVKRQSAYLALDVYLPKVQPQLMALRWIPHPFVALPASGKVFEHPMGGVSFSLKYADVFYGLVWDWENRSPHNKRDPVAKGTFGIQLTMAQFKQMLSGATGSTSATKSTGASGAGK